MKQDKNKPHEITAAEWLEIIAVSDVRDGWGLESWQTDKETTAKDFAASVYGVRFDFFSGSPGYVGDVYILLGDGLTPPMVLYREEGKLVSLDN